MNQHLIISSFAFFLTISYPGRVFPQVKSNINQHHLDTLKSTETIQYNTDTIFFNDSDYELGNFTYDPEELAQFPGGEKALLEYVVKNTKYPLSAIKDSVQGRVVIRFAIDRDGSPCDTSVFLGIRSDINTECMKVIMRMPKWKPGSDLFRAKKGLYRANIKTFYSLPFNFSLTNDRNINGIIITPRQTNDD